MTIATPEKISYLGPKSLFQKTPSVCLAAFICFFILGVAAFLMPPHSGNNGYFASLKDKHRLLQTAASPKIVFIGGSNLAFGLDSHYLEAKFHRPIVNMGLCAPFGLRFILEEIKDDIHVSDTVVLVPEYGILQNTVDGGPDLIHAVEVYPRSAFFILRSYTTSVDAFLNLLQIIKDIPAAKRDAIYRAIQASWSRGQFTLPFSNNNWEIGKQIGSLPPRFYFDKYGDYFGHFGLPNNPYVPQWELIKKTSPEATSLINDFAQLARKQGIIFVLIPPAIPAEELIPARCSPKSITAWINQQLDVPILASPKRYTLPASYFYGPPYHLNVAGRALRTAFIAEDLSNYFRTNNQPPKHIMEQTNVVCPI